MAAGQPPEPDAPGHSVGLAAGVAALTVLAIVEEAVRPSDAPLAVRLVLALLATAAILAAPRALLVALVLSVGAAAALILTVGRMPWGVLVAHGVLASAVGRRGTGPMVAGLAITSAALGATTYGNSSESAPTDAGVPMPEEPPAGVPEAQPAGLVYAVVVLLVLGVTWAIRNRREAAERALAERERAEDALAHAARGERARIARELHDVVAHHLSMISVQAETARLTAPGLAPESQQRLREIGDTARMALTEMRRLLGVLREDVAEAAGRDPVRTPQPGLAQLDSLVAEVRDRAGTPASLEVLGTPLRLDPGTELTAYRVVQEGLTNARRHAPGASVQVSVEYLADGLLVRVRDDGPGVPPGGLVTGHGLLGLRERVAMVHGRLQVGDGPRGGFVLEARVPVPSEENGIR